MARDWLNPGKPKRHILYASPMDPCPNVGQVQAFEVALAQTGCDGIIIAMSEHYPPVVPPVPIYCSLSDRIMLARALRYVVKVVTYVTEEDLDNLIKDIRPEFQLMRPSDKDNFRWADLGVKPLIMADLEAKNYRAEFLKRIQHPQH